MKTIICDIDGTLTKYMGGGHKAIMDQDHEILPGVIDHIRHWERQGHRIILITGRRESVRERTESELRRLGIPFDILLMG
ncbi:MAG: HAD hydrolase family protein, partial [Anaerolineales bacterium]|nr:HAD hydrolase family protein [Anaerolineales bacterium]